MKITLKRDWDLSVAPPNRELANSGYFAGRKNEISQLENEIMRRNSGAILISGHRGVGKTSMAYKALRNVLAHDKSLIVVLMNAAQLEVDEGNVEKINPKRIVENLIRRLYSVAVSRKIGLEEEIENLYKKAIAKEVELKELLQNSNTQEREEELERISQLQFNEINNQTLTFLVAWVLAASYQFSGIEIFQGSAFDKLIPLLLAFPVPYIFNFLIRKRILFKKTSKRSQEVAELYKIDNAIGNLEFDLETIHSKLASKGKKLVYVIDELDKLDVNQVRDVLKYFKNLFTLSEAIFVFIGGEELFSLGGTGALGNRGKEYTYFTSRYYLSRPKWEDLNDYLNLVTSNKELESSRFEVFKRAICFDSANDFFDMKSQIGDRVTRFSEENYPLIEYTESESDLIKARLHKAITMLYEERYMSLNPLRWKENEDLLRKLFTKAYEVQKSYFGYPVHDPSGADIYEQAVRDFHRLLQRLEVLTVQTERFDTINNTQVSIRNYVVSKLLPNDPPNRITDFTEYESRFISAFDGYCELILFYANIIVSNNMNRQIEMKEFLEIPNKTFDLFSGLAVNLKEIFDTQYKIYQSISKQKHPYPYQREVVEENTETIKQFVQNLVVNQTRTLLPRLIQQIMSPDKVVIASFVNNSQVFSGVSSSLKSAIMAAGIKVEVLHSPDYSRQMLFLNSGINILEGHKDILEELFQTHRVILLSNEQEKFPKIDGVSIVRNVDFESLKEQIKQVILESKSFFSN